jgi:hypothetical protein
MRKGRIFGVKERKKSLRLLAIVIGIFLIFATPLPLVSARNSDSATIGHPVLPGFTGAIPTGPHQPSFTFNPNKMCPTTTWCTYIAEYWGGVQVLKGTTILSTIAAPTSPSDPFTCPDDALYVPSTGVVWVADPCGNNDMGEIRLFDPSTNSFLSTVYNDSGANPYMMAFDSNGNVYITNPGHDQITVLDVGGSQVALLNPCGPYPVFPYLASNGDMLVSNLGVGSGCVDEFSPSYGLVVTAYASQSGGCNSRFAGIGEDSSGNVYVNCPYVSNSGGGYGIVDSQPLALFGSNSWIAIDPPTSPYIAWYLWGMQSDYGKVFPIVDYSYNYFAVINIGFTFHISSTSVGTEISLGPDSTLSCYNPGTRLMQFTNYLGGSPNYGHSIDSEVSVKETITNANWPGPPASPLGCTAGRG